MRARTLVFSWFPPGQRATWPFSGSSTAQAALINVYVQCHTGLYPAAPLPTDSTSLALVRVRSLSTSGDEKARIQAALSAARALLPRRS